MDLQSLIQNFQDKSGNAKYNRDILFQICRDELLKQKGFPLYVQTRELVSTRTKPYSLQELVKIFNSLPGQMLFSTVSSESIDALLEFNDGFILIDSQLPFEALSIQMLGFKDFPSEWITFLKKKHFDDKKKKDPTQAVVKFAFPSMDGIDMKSKKFPPVFLKDIKQNYVEGVSQKVEELLKILETSEHGLVLIHGSVGTGKTWLIRSIVSELRKVRESVVCSPPTEFILKPHYLSEVTMRTRNPLVILEDLGDIFHPDVRTRYSDHFSNLANLTDGLQSLLHNSVFLMTFNEDIQNVDPALTRDGRCLLELEVPRLTRAQAEQLVEKKLSNQTYSLAEVYAIKTGKVTKTKPKLGFLEMRSRQILEFEDDSDL